MVQKSKFSLFVRLFTTIILPLIQKYFTDVVPIVNIMQRKMKNSDIGGFYFTNTHIAPVHRPASCISNANPLKKNKRN